MATISINPLDLDANLFIGVKIPLYFSDVSSFDMNNTTVEHIKTKLKNLIFTSEGERVMNPTFGCNFNRIIFEPNNSSEMEFYIDTHIREKISKWILEVKVDDIKIDTERLDSKAIDVLIIYSIIYEPEKKETMSFSINMG